MDLAVLGHSLLTREDDLSLATLLKSPLIGLDDDDLMKFAPERKGSLADALDAVTDDQSLLDARDKIKTLRNCVEPETGKHILDCAMGIYNFKKDVKQEEIFK